MVDPWLENISAWMEQKTPSLGQDAMLTALDREWRRASLETDALLQSSQHLKKAFSELVEKHARDD